MIKVSDWHAIVPGVGDIDLPPGTACSTGLAGSLTFVSHSQIRTIDGRVHPECMEAALDYIVRISSSPGLVPGPEPDRQLAAPDTAYTKSPRE